MKITGQLVALAILSTPLVAQDSDSGPREILNSHRVSESVAACISDISKACVLTATLNTVMDESLAVERIKVLTALAHSLADAGEVDRARQSLDVAIADLDTIRFEFVKRLRRVDIAPVQAQLGDIESAITMLSTFRGLERERAIEASMLAAAKIGNVDGVLRLSEIFTMFKGRVSDYLMDSAEMMLAYNQHSSAQQLAERVRDRDVIMENPSALIRLAQVFKRVGDDVAAEALYRYAETVEVESYNIYAKFRVRLERVVYHADSGDAVAQSAALEDFSFSQKELGSDADRRDLANYYARFYLRQGQVSEAIAMGDLFANMESKADFYLRYARIPGAISNDHFITMIGDVLTGVTDIESALERDEVRIKLLRAARTLGDLELSKAIIATLEDDDNAAKGLALIYPLLTV